MKKPRHPFLWRVDAVRAGLLLCVLVPAPSSPTAWADATSPAGLEAPSVGMPVVTPKITISAPGLPEISLPAVQPRLPAIGTQTSQLSATRRIHELKIAEHRRNLETRNTHPDRIEYADALIHLERFDEAIEELEAIEEKYPEAYVNAHLLGIASEGSGNLPGALRWFAAALERDPDAQEGTGWLRVAMAEAHLALREDPDWLKTHSVLDGCAGRSEAELVRAVEVQVERQRDLFADDDPVLADLYFQVGARIAEPEARNKYFAHSLETNAIRRADIDGQRVIRARGPESTESH